MRIRRILAGVAVIAALAAGLAITPAHAVSSTQDVPTCC